MTVNVTNNTIDIVGGAFNDAFVTYTFGHPVLAGVFLLVLIFIVLKKLNADGTTTLAVMFFSTIGITALLLPEFLLILIGLIVAVIIGMTVLRIWRK